MGAKAHSIAYRLRQDIEAEIEIAVSDAVETVLSDYRIEEPLNKSRPIYQMAPDARLIDDARQIQVTGASLFADTLPLSVCDLIAELADRLERRIAGQ
jgi:hypothetical protein